jgi:hypothetical protein
LSRERVRDELTKTLLSEKPETAAEIIALGLLAPTVPEANPDLAELPALPAELPLRLALLMRRLRDCGAVSDPVTTLRALKYPRAVCESAGIGARACCGASRFGIKSAIARHGYATGRCAAACEGALAEYDDVIGSGECCTLSQLAVGGADLLAAGIQPGRTVGKTLDALLCHVIGNAEDNTRDTLLKLI